jgi:Protein of unknown function (DUF2924)
MNTSTVARVAALPSMKAPELKQLWRDLFQEEPPPFNRRFLENRLAYRIQELAYGALAPQTRKRLEQMGEKLDGGQTEIRKRRLDNRPVHGTRLIKEWQGQRIEVEVGIDDFIYAGQRYRSLTRIATVITGTHRNGWTFFGFSSARG